MHKDPKNIKVLIVEDDDYICEMYSTAFMREGFKVYTSREGKSAIQKYYHRQPDVILLDIMMPGVDGYAVLKEVRKQVDRYVPVLMLTNLDVSHFNKHDSLDQVDAYLIKSNFTPSEIVERTKEVLKVNKVLS